MKKILFFAIALVASALTFTACDGNNPSGSTDVTPAMLAGTTWRVDSSYIDGNLDYMPHLVIDVLNTEQAIFNGMDTVNYWIEGDQLSFEREDEERIAVTIKKYKKDFAIVNFAEMQADIYFAIVPKMAGQELPKTAENLVGMWKSQYYFYQHIYYNTETQTSQVDVMKHSDPGVVYLTFNADGTFVATNIVFARMDEQKEYASQTGWWAIKDGKFAYGYDEKPDQIPDYSWEEISSLTPQVFYVGQTTTSEWDGSVQESYRYYTRVE
jgi:hypothetical protein